MSRERKVERQALYRAEVLHKRTLVLFNISDDSEPDFLIIHR